MLKRRLALLLVLCLLLCGCGKQPAAVPETEPPATDAPTTAPTTVPTNQPITQPTTEPPAEQDSVLRNPLTGEILDTPHTTRATAVMFNNIEDAMPLCGITSADIVFEAIADNCTATRMEGIFSDITQAPRLGSIRSSRPYFVSIARSFGALYVHFGGSQEALGLIYDTDMDHMDGLSYDGVYFYRDQGRLNAGYDLEHTAFTSGELIDEFVQKENIPVDDGEAFSYGFVFDDDVLTEGKPATDFTIVFGAWAKRTHFVYDLGTGLYNVSQFGEPIIDGNNDEQLSFRNLILLRCPVYAQSDNYRMTMELTAGGTADLVRDGVVVPILWSRSGEDAPFVFTYEDGTPVSLGVGTTYVAILPENASFDIQ